MSRLRRGRSCRQRCGDTIVAAIPYSQQTPMPPLAWNIFRQNVAMHRQGATDLMCPVCLQPESVVPITNGHIYPEQCRSNDTAVPECKTCNNRLGSVVDGPVCAFTASLQHAWGKLSPKDAAKLFKQQARITHVEGEIVKSVGGNVSNGRVAIELGSEGALPQGTALPDGQTSLNVGVELGHSNQIVGGMLHSGLLRMFNTFGYEYAFDTAVDMIRVPLLNATRAHRDKSSVIEALSGLSETCRCLVDPLPAHYQRLFLVRDSSDVALAFGCFLRYVDKKGAMILMPGPGPAGRERYEQVMNGLRDDVGLESLRLHQTSSYRLAKRSYLDHCAKLFAAPPNRDRLRRFIIGSPNITMSADGLKDAASVPFDLTFKPLRSYRPGA